jgi:DNA polymerase III delta prime subunit
MLAGSRLLRDFEEYARGRLKDFTGREWLVKEVRAWLSHSEAPRFLLITGEPGIGKSAFAAHLWLNHRLPTAVHFCIANRGGTVEPVDFVESLHKQLRATVPGFAAAFREVEEGRWRHSQRPINIDVHIKAGNIDSGAELTGVKIIERLSDLPPERAFDVGLRQPLRLLAEQGNLPPLTLLVDALDEAWQAYQNHPNIVELLAGAADLPPQVRFILLARDKSEIRETLRPVSPKVLKADSPENQADVIQYLKDAWSKQPRLRQAVQSQGRAWDAQTFAERLGRHYEWNFLILSILLPLIAEGKIQDFEHLPAVSSLDDFYTYLLDRHIGRNFWENGGADLVETLLALQEPLTWEELAELLACERRPLHQRLDHLRPLLDPGLLESGRCWRYHWSLAEFLSDRQRAGAWWCDLQAAHRRIAAHFLQSWGGLDSALPRLSIQASEQHQYALRYLGLHLEKAGDFPALQRLLNLEREGRNLWFTMQESRGQTHVFLRDLLALWRFATEEDRRATEREGAPPAPRLGLEIRCALINASIRSLVGNIPPELLAALVQHGLWTVPEALAYLRQMPDDEQRAEALLDLASYLIQDEALAAAREIGDPFDRARALARLAPHLPPELLRAGLVAARKIGDRFDRAEALAGLAPHLPPDLQEQALREALAAAGEIRNEDARARALTGLAPHLPPKLLREALAAAREISDEYWRSEALAGLAPHLPPDLQEQVLREALAAAREIEREYNRALALAGLAPHLPPDLLPEALAAAREIKDGSARARALAGLAPHLPPELLREALAAAREIKDGSARAEALTGLAPHLPPDLLQEALAAAREIRDKDDRARALAGLAPHLPPHLLQEALAAAREIRNESDRARALAGLAPHLPPDLLPEALAAAREIRNESDRARALAGLAPYLSPDLQVQALREALAAAREIRDEATRAEVLAGLAPHLPPDLLPEALAAAREIEWEYARAEALAAAREIESESARAKALSALAKRLANQPLSWLYPLWAETLPVLARRTRKNLLSDLRALTPLIHALGGEQAVGETFRAIQDVGRWWP